MGNDPGEERKSRPEVPLFRFKRAWMRQRGWWWDICDNAADSRAPEKLPTVSSFQASPCVQSTHRERH